MVVLVQKMMSDVYPELTAAGQVIRVVAEEERRFHHTMEAGLERLEQDLDGRVGAEDDVRCLSRADGCGSSDPSCRRRRAQIPPYDGSRVGKAGTRFRWSCWCRR